MKIISTPLGFVLSFDSVKEIQGVVSHLSGMMEWIKEEKVSSPHLYAVFDDRIPRKEIDDLLDGLKEYE